MKNFVIQKNDANQRLDRFLGKMFPNVSKILIYKLLRKKQIKVNNQRAEPNQMLFLGDEITIFNNILFPENKKTDFLKAKGELSVVYEDENILIVAKPENLAVQPGENIDNLNSRIQKYLYETGQYDPNTENTFEPTVAHRIDQNTTGLVVAAKTFAALQTLNQIFHDHWIEKTYLAMVHGLLSGKGTVRNWIVKQDKFVTVHDYAVPNAKNAVTHYEAIRVVKNKYTLLKVRLETGRTHQIRATMNAIGFPLVGEQKYTRANVDKDSRFKSQALVAFSLRFKIPDPENLLFYLNETEISLPEKYWPAWVNW